MTGEDRDQSIGRGGPKGGSSRRPAGSPKGRGAKTIWRSPADGRRYAQYQAVKAVLAAVEERLLGEHGFERVSGDSTADGRERWARLQEGALRLYTRSKALIKARGEGA
jgi:hypothetical protein